MSAPGKNKYKPKKEQQKSLWKAHWHTHVLNYYKESSLHLKKEALELKIVQRKATEKVNAVAAP